MAADRDGEECPEVNAAASQIRHPGAVMWSSAKMVSRPAGPWAYFRVTEFVNGYARAIRPIWRSRECGKRGPTAAIRSVQLIWSQSMNKHTAKRKRRRAKQRLTGGIGAVRRHARQSGRTGDIQAKRNHGNAPQYTRHWPNQATHISSFGGPLF